MSVSKMQAEEPYCGPGFRQVRDHLLLRGFMDGYRWQGDEDDYEVVHGRARNEEGQQDNHRGEGGREDEESPGYDHDGDVVHSHHTAPKSASPTA